MSDLELVSIETLSPSEVERIKDSIKDDPSFKIVVLEMVKQLINLRSRTLINSSMHGKMLSKAVPSDVYITLKKLASAGIIDKDSDGEPDLTKLYIRNALKRRNRIYRQVEKLRRS